MVESGVMVTVSFVNGITNFRPVASDSSVSPSKVTT